MTTLPASGYWEDNARTEGEGKQWGEDIRDVIAELLGGSAATMLTIASGVILPISANHTIEGQGSVSDDLTNITTTNTPDGRLLLIAAYNAAHVITVKDAAGGAGQIHLLGNADYDLDATDKWITLKRIGTDWHEISRSHHGIEHERAGVDEVDGDHLDIDFTPTYSVPATTPAEAANVNDLAAHLYGIDQIIGWFARGYAMRSKFTYNGGATAYTIKCEPAVYMCKEKICQWITELTTAAIGTPAASDWYYLYLDYSAITSGTAITNAELIWSNTEPVWNDTYMGWYNGDDRCVFAVRTNSGPTNILEFNHDGGDFVAHADEIAGSTNVDPDTTWTDEILILPKFCTSGRVMFYHNYGDVATWLRYRKNGQSGTTGHRVVLANATTDPTCMCMKVMTDDAQTIEIKMDNAGTNTCDMWTQGWYFPISI